MTLNAGSKSTPGIVNDSAKCRKTHIKQNIDVTLHVKSGITKKHLNTLSIRSLKPLHNGDIIKMPCSHAIDRLTVRLDQA